MDVFNVNGKNEYIKIILEEVSDSTEKAYFRGGYEGFGRYEMKTGCDFVTGVLTCCTEDIYRFFKELQYAYQEKMGQASFYVEGEKEIEFTIEFDKNDNVHIDGEYMTVEEEVCKCYFDIESNMVEIESTLQELVVIIKKYGYYK